MVKLRGPALSLEASGSLSDALTFSSSKGRAYLKHKPTPAQPRSGNQVSMRAMMQYLSQQWQNLTAGNQATWANAYPDPSLSAYNAFIKHNLERWRRRHAPGKKYPVTDTGNPCLDLNFTATGSVRHVELKMRIDMMAGDNWGFLIFHQLGSTPPANFNKLIHVQLGNGYTWVCWTHSPLPAETHYYRIVPFWNEGKVDWSLFATDSGVAT